MSSSKTINLVYCFQNLVSYSESKKLSLFKIYGDRNAANILILLKNFLYNNDTFFLNNKVYNYKIFQKFLYFKESFYFSKNSILDFCIALNYIIPHYCYHFNLSIAGNCRMCLVELAPSFKPVASCAIPIGSNINIRTDTFLVKRAREGIMEFLLVNHPLDCPICDQGGECDLQDQGLVYGSTRGRYYHEMDFKRSVAELMCNSFIKLILTRCIHCTRCVRFLNEIGGDYTLGMLGRGNFSEIGLYNNTELVTELGSNITDFCPVGALTIKQYSLETRSWEDSYLDMIDLNDSFCAPIRVFIFENKVTRVLPKYNDELRVAWISDITRFCLDGLDLQRIVSPQLQVKKNSLLSYKLFFSTVRYLKKSFYISVSWGCASSKLREVFLSRTNSMSSNLFNTFLGDFIDLDIALKVRDRLTLFGCNNLKSLGESNNISQYLNVDFDFNYLIKITNFNNYSNIILMNLNLRFENAVLNAKLRQKVIWDKRSKVFLIGSKYNLTYKYEQLATTTKILAKIVGGRHYLCNFTVEGNKTLLLYNSDSVGKYKSFMVFFNLLKKTMKDIDITYIAKGSSAVLSLDLSLNRTIIKKSDFFIEGNYNKNLLVNFYLKCNKLLPFLVLEKTVPLHKLNISFDSYGDSYFNFVNFFLPFLYLIDQTRVTYYNNCYGVLKVHKKYLNKFKNQSKGEDKYRVFNLNDFKDDLDILDSTFDIFLMKSRVSLKKYQRIVDFIPFFELFKRRKIFFKILVQKKYYTIFYYFLLTSKYKNPFTKTLLLVNSINLSTMNFSFFKKKNNFTN